MLEGNGTQQAPLGSRPEAPTGSRSTHGVVVAITVAWFGILSSFLVLVPIYQAPDEPTQVDRILDTSEAGFPPWDGSMISADVLAGLRMMRLGDGDLRSTQDAPTRPTPAMSDLAEEGDSQVVNQLAGHPPLYYAVMGGMRTFVAGMVPRAFWQFDREVLLLRSLNLLMLLPLPLILARTAQNLGMPRSAPALAALVPLCIPQLAHIGSVVNNDNLLTLTASLSFMFAADVLVRGLRWRPGLFMAASAAAAMQTKLFGVVVGAFVAMVALIAWHRGRHRHSPVLLAALGVLMLGSWTYLRNVLLHGHPYPSVLPTGMPVRASDFVFTVSSFLGELAARTVTSFWGWFLQLRLPLPAPWLVVLTAGLAVCVVLALIRPAARWVRLMMLPMGLLVAAVATTSLVLHLETGAFPGMQGRYLFPGLAGVALAVASALSRLRPPLSVAILCGVAAVGWLTSVNVLLEYVWAGEGFAKLSSIRAWDSLGGVGVALLLATPVLVLGGLASSWLLVRGAEHAGLPPTASEREGAAGRESGHG